MITFNVHNVQKKIQQNIKGIFGSNSVKNICDVATLNENQLTDDR